MDILSFRCTHRHTAESHPQCYQRFLNGEEQDDQEYLLVENGNEAEITATLDKDTINSPEKLIKALGIDETVWYIYKKQVGKAPAWRKDRSVEWHTHNGKTEGDVSDSGKIKVIPVFSVKVWMRRRVEEIRATFVIDDLIEKIKTVSPKYPKIKYKKYKDGLVYEIAMPDLQLGRLVLENEANYENTPDITIARAEAAILDLLGRVSDLPIKKIIFPVGNDFFDSNTSAMTTAHGTPQQDDVRWQRTFDLAVKFIVKMIDAMTSIAPVDVLIVHGNHDEERVHYFGKVIWAYYHNNPNVEVDASPNKRKYRQWDKNLIMFTHGYYEKNDKLQGLMAFEKPDLWAMSKNREVHLGDKHHKVDMIYKTDELENGVVVRIFRSLATPSVWEHDKGLVGSLKAAEGLVWHPTMGVIEQKTSIP